MPRGLALLLLLSAGCSNERFIWLPPPNSALPTAFIAVGSNVVAYDLETAPAIELSSLSADSVLEAATFSESLAELGIEPGPVELDTATTSYELGDANEFFQYAVGDALQDWIETTELSESHARLRIPAAKPVDPCPDFDVELVSIQDGVFQLIGTEGPDDTIVLGGDGVYTMDASGAYRELAVDPAFRVYSAYAATGRGFWLGAGDNWRGDVDANSDRLDLTRIPSPVPRRMSGIVGDPLSNDEIYGFAYTSSTVDVFHYDGTRWVERAEVTSIDGSQELAFVDGEAIYVDNASSRSIHMRGDSVREIPAPALSVVAHVPSIGVLAGSRAEIYRLQGDRWVAFEASPMTTRYRGIVPYRDGFILIWESAIAVWLPAANGFCPPVEIEWSDLKFGHVFRDETLAVWSRGDADSMSIRAYFLREKK